MNKASFELIITEMNRIKIRHQQEVGAEYPYGDKRVPQLFVRYLFGSCPVLVRSFIEQLSNNYGRKSLGKVILSWMGYGRIEVYQIMITLFKFLGC